jgi:hypothetical protein
MTLSVDQIVNWEYQVNPKNEMIARAKKAIESLKRNKKGQQPQQNKETNKTIDNFINENYSVEIGANPYISAKETILISDKPVDKNA